MAKVTAPLFGFSASGKLADSLVYMKWKGINDVRQYVIPANPRSVDQQAQRSKMTLAVGIWHDTAWNAADLSAWDRFSATLAKIMSGFNSFVKEIISTLIAGQNFSVLSGADFSGVTDVAGTVTMKIAADKTTYLHVGTTKTSFPLSFLGVFAVDTVTFTLAGLTASTKYFCYADNTVAGDNGRTGVYDFETTA